MSSDLINAYTEIYLQQDFVNSQALAIMNDGAKSDAPWKVAIDPSALSPNDIQAMLINLAESDIKLATLQNLMKPLEEMYTNAAKNL
jgi:hypothetical protein